MASVGCRLRIKKRLCDAALNNDFWALDRYGELFRYFDDLILGLKQAKYEAEREMFSHVAVYKDNGRLVLKAEKP